MGLFSKKEIPDFSHLPLGWYTLTNIMLSDDPAKSWEDVAIHQEDGWNIYWGSGEWRLLSEKKIGKEVAGYMRKEPQPISEAQAHQLLAHFDE